MDEPNEPSSSRLFETGRTDGRSTSFRLSVELLVEVFTYLRADKASLGACSLVSRSFLAPARTQLFHTITLRETGAPFRNFTSFVAFLSSSAHVGPSVRNLTLANKGSRTSVLSVPHELFSQIVEPMSGLRSLCISDLYLPQLTITPTPTTEVLQSIRLPNVQTLIFVFPPQLVAVPFVTDIISRAPALKSLRFRGGHFSEAALESYQILPASLKLEEFSFVNLGSGLGFIGSIDRFPSLQNLRSLELAIDLVRHAKALGEVLAKYGGNLRSLSLNIAAYSSQAALSGEACHHLSLPSCLSLERAAFYIYTGTYLHPGCHSLLLTLLSCLPTTRLCEITHVMPDETARYQHQFTKMLEWSRLEEALERFPKLESFRIVKRERLSREHLPADERLRGWARESLPQLAERGVLRFE